MGIDIKLMPYRQADLSEIIFLFNDTIKKVNSQDYSEKELREWVQSEPDFKEWHTRLTETYTLLAFVSNKLVGFGNISAEGYVDMLYVSSEWIGCGVGSRLINQLEKWTISKGAKVVVTDGSITALAFFLRRGFVILKKQKEIRNGQTIINYRLEKTFIEK